MKTVNLTMFSAVAAILLPLSSSAARTVEDFNGGWEFSRDRVEWRAVDVPHDWAIEGPFDPEGEFDTGKLPWKGVGWYRKTIVMDAAPKNRRVFLDFDGVMCEGTVYVNGEACAHQLYGYLGMRADATPYLFAGKNEILVKADTTKLKSRWYPGAGIYRRVRKIETGDVYLDDRDIAVTTPEVSSERATIRVRGMATSRRGEPVEMPVLVSVASPSGAEVASARTVAKMDPYSCGEFDVSLAVLKPQLWEMKPGAALYTTRVSIGDGLDNVEFRTGMRSFRFDADEGFFLNGKHVQLKGVCLHSDLGILGMAFNRSAMRRELGIMQDMGANALRTSHNAPAPELLDLCDEMGIFVWDECFDKWNATCARGDEPLEEFVAAKLAEFARRDRNHPSVFVWSMGNEIAFGMACPPGQEHWAGSPALGTSAERCSRFRDAILAEDATRPVGMGCCFQVAAAKGHFAPLDITGWNYRQQYGEMRRCHPDKPLVYSESASAFSNYGYYADRLPTNKTDYAVGDLSVDSYDLNSAVWSDIPDWEFARMERDRFVAGEFVWTGVDYLGEPSPYRALDVNGRKVSRSESARSSHFGICDLLCFPKDRTYLYRSYWNKDAFTLHIVPDHWTFPERKGRAFPVYVYTSADEAELFLNGRSLGRRRKDPTASLEGGYYNVMKRYRLMWEDVAYEPGEIKAVAYGADGVVLGEEVLRTAGAAKSVVLSPESAVLPACRDELVFVKVTLADADGTPVPRDSRRISFAVEGPGEIVSVGNSDPRGIDSFKDTSSHPLCNGRAGLAIRRVGAGEVVLRASADGLAPAEFRFKPPEAGAPFSALRFGPSYTDPDRWPEMRYALEKNKGVFDEIWFSTGVSFPPLAWHEEQARRCARAAEDLRKMGVVPSIEIQTIIGHTDDILETGDCSGQDWGTMVSAEGLAARRISCPRDPKLVAYFTRVAELHAAWKPGSVWIDDDMSYRNRAPLKDPKNNLAGCFCDRCIAGFEKADGRSWKRDELARQIRSDAALRARWDEYSCAGYGELTRAIAAAIRKASPETVMGYQWGGKLYPAIPKGLFDGSGKRVRLRPVEGAYWDTDAYRQLHKAYSLQHMLDGVRGEAWAGDCCPEIETCPRTFACRTPNGIILEAFENLALGMDFISMFAADARTDETADFYADHLFPRLNAANPFLKGYRAANEGTKPCGFSVPNDIPAQLIPCRGVPVVPSGGLSLGKMPDVATIPIRMSGSGNVDKTSPAYQTRVMQLASSKGLLDYYSLCDRETGNKMPVLFKYPVMSFVMPRVKDDGTLVTLAIVNTSIDRQDPVEVELRGVRDGISKAVWCAPESAPVEIPLEREGGCVRLTLPRLGAWSCGYLDAR